LNKKWGWLSYFLVSPFFYWGEGAALARVDEALGGRKQDLLIFPLPSLNFHLFSLSL
jgi:hypothetical protein